jgi:hypothetical protein
MRSPRGRAGREEAGRVLGADGGGPTAWRGGEGVSGSVDGGFREAAGGEESRGAEDGGRRGRRRSGRMTAAVGEDDGGGGGRGHTDDDGSGSGTEKWPSAGGEGSLILYIETPLVPGRVTNHDKRGAFCHGW